ncbi:MAG: hypothetical protein IT379_15345, partial [Deltaproteobacteria bacterium]|nr:hypothetical protein [Deltaproteobacteria bacterium]
MSRSNKRWIALLVGVVGLATGELVWAPAGIALTFVGLFFAFGSVGSFNVFATRLVYGVVAMLHGVSVARASGSWVLGAAAFVGPLFLPPMESTNRWLGYSSTWLMAAGPIGAVALGLAAWPPSWWHLALLPTLLPS